MLIILLVIFVLGIHTGVCQELSYILKYYLMNFFSECIGKVDAVLSPVIYVPNVNVKLLSAFFYW